MDLLLMRVRIFNLTPAYCKIVLVLAGVNVQFIQVSLLETASYSNPHHSAAQKICTCVLIKVFNDHSY